MRIDQIVIGESQEMRRVHPAAEVFPMLPEDELDELAADIKANGLLHPIVLDADGVLVDGRNRLEACRRAGVEPTYTTLNGHEPVAYILSANVARRHLSRGQTAMAVARARELSRTGKSYGANRVAAAAAGVREARVSEAATILAHAPELAAAVLSGATPLDGAYEEARQRKIAQQSRDAEAKSAARDLARLRTAAPDLADAVVEERMKLRDALALLIERQEEERSRRTVATLLLTKAIAALEPHNHTPAEWAGHFLDLLNPGPLPDLTELSEARLRSCAAVLTALADQFAERNA